MTNAIVPKELLTATVGGLSFLVMAGGAEGHVATQQSDGTYAPEAPTAAGGDVVGPSSATDNAIARFDSTTGKLLQSSSATVDDLGNIATNAAFRARLAGSTIGAFHAAAGDIVYLDTSNELFLRQGSNRVIGFDYSKQVLLGNSGSGCSVSGQIIASGTICCGVYTFSTVPSAGSNTGKFLRISDRAQKHAYSDGTNWRFFGDDAIIS